MSIRTRLRPVSFPPASDICVVLDDDAANESDFLDAWRRWFALSNALMLRDASDQTVILGCATPQQPSGQETAVTTPAIDIAHVPWPAVFEILDPSPEHSDLLQDLAAHGVAEPVDGEEIGSEGIMLDLSWPEEGIAVIFEPESGDEELLAKDGWTLCRQQHTTSPRRWKTWSRGKDTMAESTIVMSKQANKLDGFLKAKTYTFLAKLAADDALPGLTVEKVKNCRDSRVRTGRVDDQYRAVLFKITGEGRNHYVLEGIYNHDQAYNVASRVELAINPLNGIPEIKEAEPSSDADTTSVSKPYVSAP